MAKKENYRWNKVIKFYYNFTMINQNYLILKQMLNISFNFKKQNKVFLIYMIKIWIKHDKIMI